MIRQTIILLGFTTILSSCYGDEKSSGNTGRKSESDDSTALEVTREREIKEGDSVEQNNNTGQGKGSGAVGQDSTANTK